MRRSKPKKYSKLDSLLEIPREVASSDIKMTINGFDEILIENYKNILEYQDILIKINTMISISHSNMNLNNIKKNNIIIHFILL